MKAYIVKVETKEGTLNLAVTLNEKRANEIALERIAEIAKYPTWWMTYRMNRVTRLPAVEVEELGDITE